MRTRQAQIQKSTHGGYSLVELLVAVSIFVVVAMVSISALISINDANKKAQAMRAVIDNLNFVMEGMARGLRVGTNYHCAPAEFINSGNAYIAKDCPNGEDGIAFEAYNGDPTDADDQIVYGLNANGQIVKSSEAGASYLPLTPYTAGLPLGLQPLTIDYLRFYVAGAETLADQTQPRIIIVVGGTARYDQSVQTRFQIQTSVSQRQIDS